MEPVTVDQSASPPVAAAVWVPISDLRPWEANPRKIPAAAVRKVKASILRWGWGAPILARRADGMVVAGHTRRLAYLQVLGADASHQLPDAPGPGMVPVRFGDWSEAEAHALAIADNRLGEEAEWDLDLVAKVLGELHAQDQSIRDLMDTGFEEAEIRKLLKEVEVTRPRDVAPAIEPGPANSMPGEVYQLGPHRLVCGDSTSTAIWQLLMAGDVADAGWTDPPYGISYKGGSGAEATGKERRQIANDDLAPAELQVFLERVFDAVLPHVRPGGAIYVASPSGPLFHAFGAVLLDRGIWRQTLAWVKDSLVLGRSDYQMAHESIFLGWTPAEIEEDASEQAPVIYGWKPGAPHTWQSDRKQTSVLQFARPKKSVDHPTMKPVELVAYCIRNSTRPGDVVFDAFGGSGTTLMACAAEGRRARLVELDPHYCDVIRRRFTLWPTENGIEPGSGAL